MSHIVSIKTEIRDADAVKAACKRLGLDQPFFGKATFYMRDEYVGWCIKLPGWLYLAVADLTTGQVHFDNFEGAWGERKHLDAFVQAYAVEKASLEARKRGHTVYEQPLADGSIKLTISVAGGCLLSKIIEIIVSPAGETKVKTRGFTGGECRDASKFVEVALGQRTAEQTTGEFFQAPQVKGDLRQSS